MNSNRKLLGIGLLAILSTQSYHALAEAQNSPQVLNSDPIDIQGELQEEEVVDKELNDYHNELKNQKRQTKLFKEKSKALNHLTKSTEKLSESAEGYVDERKEAEQQVSEYKKKMDCLLSEDSGTKEGCEKYVRNRKPKEETQTVSNRQAQHARTQEVTTEVDSEIDDENGTERPIQLLPYAGMMTYNNGSGVNFESALNAGLRAQTMVMPRLSIGIGVNYTSMAINDFRNPYYNQGLYGASYGSAFGGGVGGQMARQANFTNVGFDVYSKFYFTKGSRLKPYVGGGLGFNRASLSYANNGNGQQVYATNGTQFGNEGFTGNYVTGQLLGGAEFFFTKSIGVNIEFAYMKSLTSFGQNSLQSAMNPDQALLSTLGQQIMNSNIMSIHLGMVISF